MTSKFLVTALLGLLFAGCANGGSSGAGSTTASRHVPTAGAPRVAGDFVPTRLVPVPVPAPSETATLSGSAPLAFQKGFAFEQPPLAVTAHDVHRVMKGDPATFTLMVDHPMGARVLVHPLDPSMSLATVHLVEVASGNRLDLARDATNTVNVNHVPRTIVDDAPAEVMDGRTAPLLHPTGPVQVEARSAVAGAPQNHLRQLTFDRPFNGGMVRVEVPAAMAAAGIFVELQQPNSPVTASVIADARNHGLGEVAEIVATLMDDTTPITSGSVEGTIELPGHQKIPNLAFSPSGSGTWVAHIPLDSAEAKYVGAWNVRVRATGTSNCVAFERDVETAFGFYPSHAQITALGTPVVTRGADGLVESVSVDADVQTLVDDRFALRGVLTYTGADGAEHPLAEAQTGQLIPTGNGTMTLTFDNGSLALAGVDGPFHLRDVVLVSQGWGHTQYRLGRALDLQTPAIANREIRYPEHISLQAQDLIANGDLPAARR